MFSQGDWGAKQGDPLSLTDPSQKLSTLSNSYDKADSSSRVKVLGEDMQNGIHHALYVGIKICQYTESFFFESIRLYNKLW
jgi:hypothetical protein